MKMPSLLRTIILGAALWLPGCSKGKSNEAELVEGLKAFRDKMCACKNADCAHQVSVEFEAFSTKMDKAFAKAPGSQAPNKEAGAYVDAYFSCETNLTFHDDLGAKPQDVAPAREEPKPPADEPDPGVEEPSRAAEAPPPPRAPGQYRMKDVPDGHRPSP